MSKQNVEKILFKELEALNNTIDMKIIKGLDYSKEAREHKYLLARLIQSKKGSKPILSLFSRFSSVPTFFL
jgi:hypothetical protein